jgi:hypothetical protein
MPVATEFCAHDEGLVVNDLESLSRFRHNSFVASLTQIAMQ